MANTYMQGKAARKKTAMRAGWLLFILIIVSIIVIIRVFNPSGLSVSIGPPNNEDAYYVAKEFIKPTLKGPSISFPESGYQYAKEADSVYVIRSFSITKDESGEESKTPFEIRMKYKGGHNKNVENWSVLAID